MAAALPENIRKLGPDEDLKVGQKFYYYMTKEIAPGRYGPVKITCFVIGKYIFTDSDDIITEPGQILYFLHEMEPGNRLFCMLSPFHDKSRLEYSHHYSFMAFGGFDVFIDENPFNVKDYINVSVDSSTITEKDKELFELYSHWPKSGFNFDVLRYKYVPSIDAEIGHLYFLKGLTGNDLQLIQVVSKERYLLDDSNFLIKFTLPYSTHPDTIYRHAIWNTPHPTIIHYGLFKIPSLEDIRNAAWKRRSHAVRAYYSVRHPKPKNNGANGSKTRRGRRHQLRK